MFHTSSTQRMDKSDYWICLVHVCPNPKEIRRAQSGALRGEDPRVPGTEITNLRGRRRPTTGDAGEGTLGLATKVRFRLTFVLLQSDSSIRVESPFICPYNEDGKC